MSWFSRWCRNLGLMVHNIRHPEPEPRERKVVRREVERERRGNVTLRRTTIEEIEFHGEGQEDPQEGQEHGRRRRGGE